MEGFSVVIKELPSGTPQIETSCGQNCKTRESQSGFCYCLSNNFKTLLLDNFIIRSTNIISP